MKLILFGLAFVAVAFAKPSSIYLPPAEDVSVVAAPTNEYFAPAVEEQTVLADDGYRYKTVRRQRRDVSELTSAQYLPPTQEATIEFAAPSNEYLAPAVEEQTVLADDGYRYKTVRRHRQRRDVSELTSAQYLPPTQEATIEIAAPSNEYLAPAVEEQTVLADDGYRYKTVRRHRQRRDVSELTSAQYLPPTQEATIEIAAPSNEYLAPAVEEQTVLADDGYRYKTVRRHRQRRDVSELTSAQYLPPTQEATIEIAAPSNEYLAPAVEEQTVLADDGYRYKTVRRHRQRRDVSELTSAQYLPPTQEATIEIAAPSNEYLAPAVEEQTVLADDGYRYKTVRRHRQRRDVSELTSAQYLPPTQEATIEIAAPSNEYLAPAVEEQTVLADDGYRYKTVRRHRQRRDVSELTSAQYLPPTQEATIEIAAPSNEYLAPAVEEQTVLADDGYRYKTVRRHRQRRDVSELTSAQYLPPNQEVSFEVAAPSNEYLAPAVEEQTVLADDGYRYKTVRRHRQRRDVSELTSAQYLPPTQEVSFEVAAPSNEYLAPAVEEQTVLADDGYRYKTVRRHRQRRDVNELTSGQYLPPTEEVSFEVAAPSNEYLAPALEEQTLVADDGYRYKTVKKFKTRRH